MEAHHQYITSSTIPAQHQSNTSVVPVHYQRKQHMYCTSTVQHHCTAIEVPAQCRYGSNTALVQYQRTTIVEPAAQNHCSATIVNVWYTNSTSDEATQCYVCSWGARVGAMFRTTFGPDSAPLLGDLPVDLPRAPNRIPPHISQGTAPTETSRFA